MERTNHPNPFKCFVDSAHRLLAPAGDRCLTCGKTAVLHREHFGVCPPCFFNIPWIMAPRCRCCGRQIGCPDCTRKGGSPNHFVLNRSSVPYNAAMREWLAQYKYRGNERYACLLAGMLGHAYTLIEQEVARRLQESEGYRKKNSLLKDPWRIDAVTSVPVSDERLRERGFNQAEVLARGLAAEVNTPYIELLCRKRHTDKQSFKSRMDRLKDMEGVFGCLTEAPMRMQQILSSGQSLLPQKPFSLSNPATFSHSSSPAAYVDPPLKLLSVKYPYEPAPLRILLVDDIYTTGSTINACAMALRETGGLLNLEVEVYSLTWARS